MESKPSAAYILYFIEISRDSTQGEAEPVPVILRLIVGGLEQVVY